MQVNQPKAWSVVCASGSAYSANRIVMPVLSQNVTVAASGCAASLVIDGTAIVSSGFLNCRLNNDDSAVFQVTGNKIYSWSVNDLHVNRVEFANPGNDPQTVVVIAGVSQDPWR